MSKSSEIRVQYSGFIVFTAQVLGVITGLIYTLLLTRNMSPVQYGIWTNIFDYTPYFMLFSNILPFWVTRFCAREKEGTVKTSAITQFLIAIISLLFYFPAIFLISHAIGTTPYLLIYFITGFYVLDFYLIAIFESALNAIRPQSVGYGFIIQEVIKVSVAVILILGLGQIFLGAILGLVLGTSVQIFYYVYLLRDYFREKFAWGYVKEWFKGSPAIAYNAVGSQLAAFVFILLFLYGGAITRAYYQAALSFTTIIGYASSLAVALYPKLLANSCSDEQISLSFKTVMMLAIPFSTLTIVMSVSFLTILNPAHAAYSVAWPVLIALTIDTLATLLYTFYSSCVMGVERFDAEGKISISQLVRSKIFKVFTIPYVQAAVALPVAYLILTRGHVAGSVQATVAVIAILIGVHLSSFIGLYAFMHHSIRIPVAWKSIGKYVLSALVMGVVLFLLPTTSTLLSTVAKAIGGFGLYVVLLLAIDKEARELVKLIWLEIKVTFRALTSKEGVDEKNRVSLGEN